MGCIVGFASESRKRANETAQGGLFTTSIITRMMGRQGKAVSATELLDDVCKDVCQSSSHQQVPATYKANSIGAKLVCPGGEARLCVVPSGQWSAVTVKDVASKLLLALQKQVCDFRISYSQFVYGNNIHASSSLFFAAL